MDCKKQGEITELRFYLMAFEKGLIISKPFGDNQKYDFIVDAKGRLSRVQVKSVSMKDKYSRGRMRYRINASFGATHKHVYSKEIIDFLVVFVIPENTWYVVPIEAIPGIKTLAFRPDRESKGKLEIYREAWNLFE